MGTGHGPSHDRITLMVHSLGLMWVLSSPSSCILIGLMETGVTLPICRKGRVLVWDPSVQSEKSFSYSTVFGSKRNNSEASDIRSCTSSRLRY